MGGDLEEARRRIARARDGSPVLSLERLGLTTVPDSIVELGALESLDLQGNRLATLPEAITKLTSLRTLHLHDNQLTTLPEAVTKLTSLETLALQDNRLTTLPEVITRLANLQMLFLHRNHLTALLEAVSRLTKLRILNLASNQLTVFDEAISKLTNLEKLDLTDNGLTALPETIGKLARLERLYLASNQLTKLPEGVTRLTRLRTLDLSANPIETPPHEICSKGLRAIQSYFKQRIEYGTRRLFEAKILVVGEPGAGKTSLTKKLLEPNCDLDDEEESTLGIRVHPGWTFLCPSHPAQTFKANLWDFGGQEIQYMTHQYFLSGRSVYVLVADDREQRTNFYYWFKVIRLLGRDRRSGENSPVVVVLNERGGNKATNFELGTMRGLFPELKMDCVCLDLNQKGAAIASLVERIQRAASSLPHIGVELPAPWVPIRELLDDDVRTHISYDQYLAICRDSGLSDRSDCETLSQYLNDLGVILHYPDDPQLKDLVILRASWLLDAIYATLSNSELHKEGGRFSRKWIYDLWQKDGYHPDECTKLLQLMSRDHFEICYPLPNTDDFMAPQLLDSTRPGPAWDDRDNLEFQYVYKFLPAGVLTRLIVRRHEDIATSEVALVWKTGVVLESTQGARAEVTQVKVDDGGMESIRVRVVGEPSARLSLLMIVRDELEKIHEKSFPDIGVDRRIPCGCEREGIGEGPTELFSFDKLKQHLGQGTAELPCPRCGRSRPIWELLEGIHKEIRDDTEKQAVSGFVDQLERLISAAGSLRSAPVITVSPTISATAGAEANVNVEITVQVQRNIGELRGGFQPVFSELRDVADILPNVSDVDRAFFQRDLDRTTEALAALTSAESKEALRESGALQTVKSFLDNLEDTDTRVGRLFESVEKGAKKLQGLARTYNKLADWAILPRMPEILAGKDAE